MEIVFYATITGLVIVNISFSLYMRSKSKIHSNDILDSKKKETKKSNNEGIGI